jgi:hypothetical protein
VTFVLLDECPHKVCLSHGLAFVGADTNQRSQCNISTRTSAVMCSLVTNVLIGCSATFTSFMLEQVSALEEVPNVISEFTVERRDDICVRVNQPQPISIEHGCFFELLVCKAIELLPPLLGHHEAGCDEIGQCNGEMSAQKLGDILKPKLVACRANASVDRRHDSRATGLSVDHMNPFSAENQSLPIHKERER